MVKVKSVIDESKLLTAILAFQIILRDGIFDIFQVNDIVVGSIRLRDFYFLVETSWFLMVLFYFKGKIRNPFANLAWLYMLLIFINTVTSFIYFQQPLILGFQVQRDIFSGFCFLLAWGELAWRRKITGNRILAVIKLVCIVKLTLDTLHWILFSTSGFILLQGAQLFTERYGSARIVFSQVEIIALLAAICLNEVFHKKRIFTNALLFLWSIGFFMIETKLRASTLAFIISFIIAVLFWKRTGIRKSIVIIFSISLFFIFFNRIPLIKDLFQTLLEGKSTSANTLSIRESAQAYYFNEFLKSPIFGWGYPHFDWEPSFLRQGKSMGYFFSDNGIFSFIYIYGGIGIAYFIGLLVTYIKSARINYLVNNDYIGIFWGVYQLIMLATGMFWIIGNYQISFMLVLVYFIAKESERKRGKLVI